MPDVAWSWEHKRKNVEDIAEHTIAAFRRAARHAQRQIREIQRGPSAQRLSRSAEVPELEAMQRSADGLTQAIMQALAKWPRWGEFNEAIMTAPPPGLPGYDPDAPNSMRDDAWREIEAILESDPDPISRLANIYSSMVVNAMIEQVKGRYGVHVASTPERQRELGILAALFAVAVDIVWPMTNRLERGDVGRYVITPDLLMTLLNSKAPEPPSADNARAYRQWIDDHRLPHPIMVFRVPSLDVRVEPDESGQLSAFVRDGILDVAPGGTLADGWTLPESDLFVTTVGDLIATSHGEVEQADLREFPPSTILIAQVSVNAPVIDADNDERYPATMINSLVLLGPPDPPHAFNMVGYIGRVEDEPSAHLEQVTFALAGLWRAITLTLLSWFNDPKGQALRRVGIRRVTPSSMTEPKRGRQKKRKVVRYEVLGEAMRWEPELENAPGMRGSPMVRSFVRGHWYRWPRLRDKDPVFQTALGCLAELDELLIPDQFQGRPVDLEVFQKALENCVTGIQGVDVRRRQPDIGERLVCTLLLLGTDTGSPLASSPLWQRHRGILEPAAHEMCRLRRTWKWPHWRGPEEGDELLAVTFLQ